MPASKMNSKGILMAVGTLALLAMVYVGTRGGNPAQEPHFTEGGVQEEHVAMNRGQRREFVHDEAAVEGQNSRRHRRRRRRRHQQRMQTWWMFSSKPRRATSR